jgi:dTDP-4-amino-4,6-dideoxygalactose transaminase
MRDVPALLGGTPIFQTKVNIVRPVMPDYSELIDGVKDIVGTGMVTKGKYLRAFEDAIASHLNVKHA